MPAATGQCQAGVSSASQKFARFRILLIFTFLVLGRMGVLLTMEFPEAGLKRSGQDDLRQLACVCLRSLFYSTGFATDTSRDDCTFAHSDRGRCRATNHGR